MKNKNKILSSHSLKIIIVCLLTFCIIGATLLAHANPNNTKQASKTKISKSVVLNKKPVVVKGATVVKPVQQPVATQNSQPVVSKATIPVLRPVLNSSPVITTSPGSSVNSLTPAPSSSPPVSGSTGQPTSGSSTPPATSDYTSTNWSGYLSISGVFSSISGSWMASNPMAQNGTVSADGTWIGIGGVTSNDLIQIGTQNTINASGQVTTSAFYEILPALAQNILTITVTPGDKITASVSEISPGQWLINITDITTSQSYSNTIAYSSSHSSAEWIEEDPSYSNGNLVPFDNFSVAYFTHCSAIISGTQSSIINSTPKSISLVNSKGVVIAKPTAISSSGSDFTINQY